MNTLTKIIGEKIKQNREQKNLTQSDMANKLAISDSAYGKLERGETKYDIERLKEIADILDTSISNLIGCDVFYNLEYKTASSPATHFYPSTIFDKEIADSFVYTIKQLPKLIEAQNQLIQTLNNIICKKTDFGV